MDTKHIAKELIDLVDGTEFKVEYIKGNTYLWGHYGRELLFSFSMYKFYTKSRTNSIYAECKNRIEQHKRRIREQ